MTKPRYSPRQIFEIPSKSGFIRAEKSEGNATSLVLSYKIFEDDSPDCQTFVFVDRRQWEDLVRIVPGLMGWEVAK